MLFYITEPARVIPERAKIYNFIYKPLQEIKDFPAYSGRLYRSIGFKQITSIGVVESIHTRITNLDEIVRLVGKRTIYSRNEIEKMAENPTTVILFFHISHLPSPIGFNELKEIGALSSPPQSIGAINEECYHEIIKRSGIDERFTIH